ncbi:MAG: LysR family transcriptional regulator [Rhodobacteraceae bacterium]|jgi:DNA-binding transcriptional LysR family regulator|nr:LysR family transcriptional regulator [Paracoccaceae bacterium]
MSTPETAAVRGLKLSHLRLMAEILATGQLSHAAERLGLAQPAASRLLAEAERLTGRPLHSRDGRGLRLTAAGEALARRAARIQIELSDAAREMTEAGSGTEGLVRIGAVTGPALNRVLPAVRDLTARHPGLRFEVTVGTSPPLCDQLLAGRLDFAIGRLLSPDLERSLTLERMEEEPLSLIVRRGHPLLFRPVLTPADTLAYDWVMPEGETLLTRTVIDGLIALGLGEPRRQVSTASFLFTLALLTESDAIAPLAEAVADSFAVGPAMPFVPLPVETGISVTAYGLIRRRGGHLTPAAERVAARILATRPRRAR